RGDRERDPCPLRLFAPRRGNQSRGSDHGRAPRTSDAELEYPGADVRARGGPHLGEEPAALLGHPGLEPRRPGAGLPCSRRRARASFRLGRERFEQKLKLDEGISIPIDRLLAIAVRELRNTQEAFRTVAGRMNGGDPLEAWSRTKAQHPAPGELIAAGRHQLE